MKKIQMVDLQSQYNKIKDVVDSSIINVMENASFINGPTVKSFQKNLEDYLGVKHVIPCANGTDALQIAMMSLDLKPGDEVITTNFTFAATVEVISLLNLKPVLVDVELDSFNIDCNKIKKAITSKTKAIVPVHLFGQSADMEKVMQIAKEYNLYVIEDNAQAIGASFQFSSGIKRKTGTIGDIGTTSFFPSKNLGCFGDGGALFTNNDDLAYKIRGIVNHGMYERYHHDVVGVNSRLDSVQAAVLDAKLPHLNSYNKSRQTSAKKYTELLKGCDKIKTPMFSNGCIDLCSNCHCHVFHQYTIRILDDKRDDLSKYLSDLKIPFGIYYPIPLHKQKAYKNKDYDDEDFLNTNLLSSQVISLPMHSELNDEQIEYISGKITKFLS
ncbi:MAG: DegT/DnrJ/EryC1/StrS family aminotransferase [Bacteroidota bacterium]|nr:DegT/DnrJ/EryC1/StrS family aminotransferase [Bacteroidota bacterium]